MVQNIVCIGYHFGIFGHIFNRSSNIKLLVAKLAQRKVGASDIHTLAVCFVGLENLIEGDLKPGQKVVVIEDLVSTGGSSIKAVESIRKAGCEVIGMAAIFTYGFPEAERRFKEADVELVTLSNYNAMLEVAIETNYIAPEYLETLQEWRKDPANWKAQK